MKHFKPLTVVRGIRATDDFWRRCDIVARLEKTDRNKLIVRVMSNYYNEKIKERESKNNRGG